MDKTPLDRLASAFSSDPAVARSQLFGKPCLTVNGKAFLAWFRDEQMVFKLDPDTRAYTLKLEGATNWDPSGKGRPMKEWIAVPLTHSRQWLKLARKAREYAGG